MTAAPDAAVARKRTGPSRWMILFFVGFAAWLVYNFFMPARWPFLVLFWLTGSITAMVWVLAVLLCLAWTSVLLLSQYDYLHKLSGLFSTPVKWAMIMIAVLVGVFAMPLLPGRMAEHGSELREQVVAAGYQARDASAVTAVMVCAYLMFIIALRLAILELMQTQTRRSGFMSAVNDSQAASRESHDLIMAMSNAADPEQRAALHARYEVVRKAMEDAQARMLPTRTPGRFVRALMITVVVEAAVWAGIAITVLRIYRL